MEPPLKRKVCDEAFEPKSLAQIQLQVEISAAAACMRRELQRDLEEEEWVRRPHKQLIAEANLLLQLTRKPPVSVCKSFKPRCGTCDNCMLGDCGECGNCLDKRRYGGRGVRKQACSMRRCLNARDGEKRVVS